jgi:hypothetical protein
LVNANLIGIILVVIAVGFAKVSERFAQIVLVVTVLIDKRFLARRES